MKNFNFKKIIFMTAMAALLLVSVQFSSSVLAFSISSEINAEALQASSVSGDVVGYVYRNGEKMRASNVLPGETIYWEMTLVNSGSRPVTNIKFDGDIPTGTIYVVNSASNVEFSLDGKIFSANPMITDSEGRRVSAPVSSYRAIRFTVSLKAGETKTLTYKTTVK